MKDIMLSWKKYLIEQTDTAQTMVSSITGSASEELKPTEQEVKDQAMSTIAASVENSFHDAKAVADRTGVDKSQLRAKLKAEIDQIIKENLYQVILEKNDRCTRIAKRKYKVWPSAYASGSVVKCRQGKIWKGISENMTDEEIDEALLLEDSRYSKELKKLNIGDQELRNIFSQRIQQNKGWSQELVDKFVEEFKTNKNDVFGDSKRKEELSILIPKLDYQNFSTKDWDNLNPLIMHLRESKYHKLRMFVLEQMKKRNFNWRPLATDIARENNLLPELNGVTLSYPEDTNDNGKVSLLLKKKSITWDKLLEQISSINEAKKKKDYKPNFSKEKEQGLHGWFARNKGKGWVNCRTGGPCGRESADSGGKYPACRPTKAQCKSAGKGPLRKKKSSKPISWTKKKKKD